MALTHVAIGRRAFLVGITLSALVSSYASARRLPRARGARDAELIGDGEGERLWGERIFDEPLQAHDEPEGVAASPVLPDAGTQDDALASQQASAIPRSEVAYDRYAPRTIVVSTQERRLYLVEGGGLALRYGIAVGKQGFQWQGREVVSQKRAWPDWFPPPEMLQRRPDLPRRMSGGLNNPLGARALYLGDTLYRIHGTNEPASIGKSVSSGCIRMANADIIDLYERVPIGSPVVVE